MANKSLGLVIAGGKGTRLAPLTCTTPKHLLPIGDKSLLDHILDGMLSVDKVIVAAEFRGSQVNDHVLSRSDMHLKRHTVVYDSEKGDPTITHGPWGAVLLHLESQIFDVAVVWFGDVFCKLDIWKPLEQHLKTDAYITAVCSPATDNSDLRGVFTRTCAGIATDHKEKFVSIGDIVNVGIYILSPLALSLISDKDEFPLAEPDVFPSLLDTGRFYTYIYQGYHRNINTPTDLLHANLTYSLEYGDQTETFTTVPDSKEGNKKLTSFTLI